MLCNVLKASKWNLLNILISLVFEEIFILYQFCFTTMLQVSLVDGRIIYFYFQEEEVVEIEHFLSSWFIPFGWKKNRFFSGLHHDMMTYLSYTSSLREEKDVLGLSTQRNHLIWIPPVCSLQNSATYNRGMTGGFGGREPRETQWKQRDWKWDSEKVSGFTVSASNGSEISVGGALSLIIPSPKHCCK